MDRSATPQPTVNALAAITLDGKIARHARHFTNWTSPEDKAVFREHMNGSDVVVAGNNTYKTAEMFLSKRNCIVFTRSVPTAERLRDNLLMLNPEGAAIQEFLGVYRTVALIGGTEVYTYFLERGLIDNLYLTIEPLIFGNGLDLFRLEGETSARFQLESSRQLNDAGSLLLHYRKLVNARIERERQAPQSG
jgi:dihydrofolate reductase